MKIVAQTINGFMLEADMNEIILLLGFKSQYDDGMKKIRVSIGLEMELTKIARSCEFLRTLDDEKLRHIKLQLSSIQTALEQTSDTINAITVFETLKDTEKVQDGS